jgi:hypothetical protein
MLLNTSLRIHATALLLGAILYAFTPAPATAQLVQNTVSEPCDTCQPVDMKFVDLNNDATLDLLVISEEDLRVSWFEGLGSGAFGPQQVIFDDWVSIKTSSNNARPTKVTTGDLDGDGLPEVIVVDNAQSSGNGALVYFENRTDSGGSPFGAVNVITQSLRKPQEIVATDFDNDADVDLVVISSLSPNVVTWFSNDGNGVMTREGDILDIPGSPFAMDVADVGGDGDQDILVAYPFADEFYFIENTRNVTGTESYAAPVRTAASNMDPEQLAFADLDSDGILDIIVAEHGTDEMVWYPGDGTGGFGARDKIANALNVDDFEVADVDLDGDQDIFILNQDGLEDLSLLINIGSASFARSDLAADVGPMIALDAADFVGDSRPDIGYALLGSDYVAYLENQTASGMWGSEVRITQRSDVIAPQDAIPADLDGDTWDDIVVASRTDGLLWYRNQQDGTFAAAEVLSADANVIVRAGDMDQDGDLDLVASDNNPMFYYENRLDEASNDFASGLQFTGSFARLSDIEIADFDGDTFPDVIVTDQFRNSLSYFINELDQASADFAGGVEFTTSATRARGVDVADFDLDGDIDLAYGTNGSDDVAWVENDFSGSTNGFIFPVIIDNSVNALGAWVGDFDNDGRPDIMTGEGGGGDLRYYLNQLDDSGTSPFSSFNETSNALNPRAMAVGDLTDDGIDDLVFIFTLDNINRSEIYVITSTPGVGSGFDPRILVTNQVNGLSAVGIADFDKDGLPDILSSSIDDNRVAWYPNDQSVLPVELAGFDGFFDGHAVTLTWETLSENGNHGFAVERQTESGTFREVGYQRGAGTTDVPQSYRFTDRTVPTGTAAVTYRLRQVDVDGDESVSAPVTVRRQLDGVRLGGINPHPVRQSADLTVHAPEATDVTMHVYDVMGRRVATLMNGPVTAGRHTAQLDASGLASGTYFVRVVAGDTTITEPITVIR